MTDVYRIVLAFLDCDVPKNTVIEIMHELLDNCDLYIDNEEAIDELLKSRLDIDS